MREMSPSVQVTARMSPDLVERLDRVAAALSTTRAGAIIRACEEFVEQYLEKTCLSCGHLSPGARFCPACGAPITVPARREMVAALEAVWGSPAYKELVDKLKEEIGKC